MSRLIRTYRVNNKVGIDVIVRSELMSKLESRSKLSGVKAGRVETEAEVKLVKVGIKDEIKVDIQTEEVHAKLLV